VLVPSPPTRLLMSPPWVAYRRCRRERVGPTLHLFEEFRERHPKTAGEDRRGSQ